MLYGAEMLYRILRIHVYQNYGLREGGGSMREEGGSMPISFQIVPIVVRKTQRN